MNKNTPQAKGVRTALQTIVGAVITFFAGLVALPEVREYTSNFIRTQGLAALFAVLAALGVSAGLVALLQNKVEDK